MSELSLENVLKYATRSNKSIFFSPDVVLAYILEIRSGNWNNGSEKVKVIFQKLWQKLQRLSSLSLST